MIPSREIPLHSSKLPSQRDITKEGEDKSTTEQCGTVWPALYRNAELSE